MLGKEYLIMDAKMITFRSKVQTCKTSEDKICVVYVHS